MRRGQHRASVLIASVAVLACASIASGCAPPGEPDVPVTFLVSENLPRSIAGGYGDDGYLWRSADVFIDDRGRALPDAPRWLRDAEADEAGTLVGVPQIIIKDCFAPIDHSWPKSLRELVIRAHAMLSGTIVGTAPGFLYDYEAGLMLEVEVEHRPKPAPAYRDDRVFVFYPAGEVPIGSFVARRLASQIPSPPGVGDRLLIATRRGPIHASPPIVELLGTGVEVLIASGDRLLISTGLEQVHELREPGASFDALVRRARVLAQRCGRFEFCFPQPF